MEVQLLLQSLYFAHFAYFACLCIHRYIPITIYPLPSFLSLSLSLSLKVYNHPLTTAASQPGQLTIFSSSRIQRLDLLLEAGYATAQRYGAQVYPVRLVYQVPEQVLGVFGDAAQLLYESGERVDHHAFQLVLDLGGERRAAHENRLHGSLHQRHDGSSCSACFSLLVDKYNRCFLAVSVSVLTQPLRSPDMTVSILSPVYFIRGQYILSGGDSISLVYSIRSPDILSLRALCIKTPRKSVSHISGGTRTGNVVWREKGYFTK